MKDARAAASIVQQTAEAEQGEQPASAIETVALLRLLQRVAVAANEAESVDEVMHLALDEVCAATGWPVGHVYQRARNAEVLRASEIWHLQEPEHFAALHEVTMQTSFGPGEGLPGRVLETGKAAWVADVRVDDNFPRARLSRNLGVISAFAFPVMARRKVVAVLEFFSAEPRSLDAELLEVMSSIGTQLGRVVERKQAEAALLASEERLRAHLDSAVDAIVTADVDGRVLEWNRGAERIFGYTREEIVGEPLHRLMPERYVEAHNQGMARVNEGGERHVIGRIVELHARRKEGSELPVELSLSAWGDGEARYYTAIIRDITSRKHTEEVLRKREQQLARAQEIAHLGNWEWVIDSGALTWSDELYRIYGLEPGEPLSFERFTELVHPDDRAEVQQAIEHTFETHEPFMFFHRIRRADDGRERVLRGEGQPVIGADGQVVKMFGTGQDVTEMKRVEEELRRREAQSRALLDAQPDAMARLSREGVYLDIKAPADYLSFMAPEELMGSSMDDVLPPEVARTARARIEAALETGEMQVFEYEMVIQGQQRIREARVVVSGDDEVLAVMRDITDRKRAERVLRERERQQARAQEIAHLGSWEWNPQTGELTWSDELYRIYDLEPGTQVSYEKYMERLHPDDREEVARWIDEALQDHKPFNFFERIVRPDGSVRILNTAGEVAIDEAGALRLVGVCHDVTEARRAEAELRESEQRFRLLAENMTDLVALHDAQGTYLYLSPSVERILGYAPDELIGATPYTLIHPEDAERVRQGAHYDILQGEGFVESTVRMRRKDGSYVWLESTGRPIMDEDGRVIRMLSSSRDVTERVRAEQLAARSRAALEQRNRELQDFAYVASHDLQEPLRKIRAFSDLLKEDYGSALDETGVYFLHRMQEAATRMSTLISDLLDFSRITTKAQPFVHVNLDKVVREAISDLEFRITETGGRVEVEPMPEIEADVTQMRQLFQNLIGNALKFHRPNVPPLIEISVRKERSSVLPGGESQPVCHIEVRDNGIGFDEKYLDRIFTPFQRLHSREEFIGTGMGLAICRRIVERHNGLITARSRLDAGSTFIVTLPLQQPQETEHSE